MPQFLGDMIGQVSCQFNEMMSMDSSTVLQHPRRNLGNRYRSQAATDKLMKLELRTPVSPPMVDGISAAIVLA